jgi:hypothetical protein
VLVSLTGLGLATAAGLNAYIPLLMVGLISRYTAFLDLPRPYAWLENGWVLLAIAALLAVELVFDKIPVVDHVNNAVQTLVRPTVGGVTFAAMAAQLDESAWVGEHAWVTGIAIAGIVHAGKSGLRPLVHVVTQGFGTPVVSATEDAGSLFLSIVAVLAPLLVLVVLAATAVSAVLLVRGLRRRRRRFATPPGFA